MIAFFFLLTSRTRVAVNTMYSDLYKNQTSDAPPREGKGGRGDRATMNRRHETVMKRNRHETPTKWVTSTGLLNHQKTARVATCCHTSKHRSRNYYTPDTGYRLRATTLKSGV